MFGNSKKYCNVFNGDPNNLSQKLISEAVMEIYSYAPGGKPTAETEKRKAAKNAYAIAIINKW